MMRAAIHLACIALLQFSGVAYAQSASSPVDFVYPAPHFRNIVAAASRIARVRIIKREALYGDAIHQTAVCAYLMTATVVEAFKGGTSPFEFISAVQTDFPDSNQDYLVIAESQPGISQATRFALGELIQHRDSTSGEIACLLRQLSHPGYYVPALYKTSWEFDEQAHKEFGHEWLRASTRADGLFCGLHAKEYREHSTHSAFDIRVIGTGANERYVVAWSDVRRLLEAKPMAQNLRFPCE